MAVKTYDSKDVQLIVGGIPIKSFGSDTMLTVTPNEDRGVWKEGITGEDGCYSVVRKLGGTLSVTVLAESTEDLLFDQLQTLRKPVPLLLRLPAQNKILVSEAWYQAQPDVVVGTEVDDRSHTLGIKNSSFSLLDSADSVLDQFEQLFG